MQGLLLQDVCTSICTFRYRAVKPRTPQLVAHFDMKMPDNQLFYVDEWKLQSPGLEVMQPACCCCPSAAPGLAQNKYFEDTAFLNYLKYLEYWRRPEYAKYIR